jgi:hypothetical protein
MPRPVTLFTGQWADLAPAKSSRRSSKAMGYDGVGTRLLGRPLRRRSRAARRGNYVPRQVGAARSEHGLTCHAVSSHLGRPGRLRPDRRAPPGHPAPDVWGDGDPEGVRKRAAKKMIATGQGRAELLRRQARPQSQRRIPRASSTASPVRPSGTRSTPSRRPRQDFWDAGLRRLRQALAARSSRPSRRRNVNFAPRGPPDRDRLRHRFRASAPSTPSRATRRFGFNYDPSPPRLPGRRLREVHPHLRRAAFSTPT